MEKEGSLFSTLASKIKNVDGKLIGKDDKDTKPVSFASIFKDNTPKKTVKLSELSNEESVEGADVAIPLATVDEVSSKKTLVDSLVVAIPFQDGSGHSMKTIDIEYEWQPPRCDTCKMFDHVDDQCPKKVKVAAPTQVSDDGFVEEIRSIFELIKSNVNGKASTSQPKENKEAASQPNSNAFYGLEEDNGKLVDDTRKKVEAPPKKTPRNFLLKYGIWLGTSGVCKKWKEGVKQSIGRRERLSFAGWKMDDESTSRLVTYAYSLKELDISKSCWGCQITDNGLYQLSAAKCVTNLSSISHNGISRANSLQHLNIGGTFITDESLLAIATSCPNLKTAVLWGCRHVTENGLIVLVNNCRKLETINVWGMRVPVDSFYSLLAIRPALQILPQSLLNIGTISLLPVF
ncbi:F-box protein [Tanacetum coccineum]